MAVLTDQLQMSFANLIHAVVMADGIRSDAEQEILDMHLSGHPAKNYLDRLFEQYDETASFVASFKEIRDYVMDNGVTETFKAFLKVLEDLLKLSSIPTHKFEILELIWDNLKQLEEKYALPLHQ